MPDVELSPDRDNDFLLALAEVARADYLVTGDKSDLLSLESNGVTRIVTAQLLVERLDK